MTLGERMIKYRAVQRISQSKLAEQCGVSLQTICSIETGQQNPSKVTEQKIKLVIGEEE